MVLDPSVGAKWYLQDEPGAEAADRWLAALLAAEVGLIVPHLFYDELGNSLVKASAAHHPRISKIEARAVFLRTLGLPLEPVTVTTADRERAFQLAIRHSKGYYDMGSTSPWRSASTANGSQPTRGS